MAVKAGDILRDKYRIDALIGRGGMGHVFAATSLHTPVRAQVAIKVVSRLLVDDILMMRLHREAEAAQRIQSEFVPRVIEVSDTEDGETFLVMERLVGEPLSQRIRDNGSLPWHEVARIGDDVLRGLIDAHEAGIVHRDLKPSNVFLALKASRLRAMVLDFGVCKMAGLDAERLTGTGESIGTVAYMAPEQIRGAARVDVRADLYAFGVLIFEMLSGRLPHEGPSQMAILASKLENDAARLRDCTRVTIPQAVDELVSNVLERDPERRIGSAKELLDAWRAITKDDPQIAATSSNPAPISQPDDVTASGDAPTVISRHPPAVEEAHVAQAAHAADGGDTDDDLREEAQRSFPSQSETPRAGSFLRRARPPAPSSHPTGPTFQPQDPIAQPSYPPSAHASLPPEPHPTQTSLTTHAGSSRRVDKKSARVALLLATFGLIAGVVVVAVSFAREEPKTTTITSGASNASSAATADPSADLATAPIVNALTAAPVTTVITPEGESISSDDPSSDSFELPADPAQKPMSKAPYRGPTSGGHRVPHTPPSKSGTPKITSQPRY